MVTITVGAFVLSVGVRVVIPVDPGRKNGHIPQSQERCKGMLRTGHDGDSYELITSSRLTPYFKSKPCSHRTHLKTSSGATARVRTYKSMFVQYQQLGQIKYSFLFSTGIKK